MSAELEAAFDSISKIVEAAEDDRERFGNIAATIRINALRNGATTDEAEAMVRGEIDFIKWVCAKVEANAAQSEHEPQSCTEADGCPTENAVLKRFWREHQARTDLTPPAADYVAGLGLKRIVEEIDGAMKHGTWRDEHGMRLKDTPEWVAFYVALAQIGAKP